VPELLGRSRSVPELLGRSRSSRSVPDLQKVETQKAVSAHRGRLSLHPLRRSMRLLLYPLPQGKGSHAMTTAERLLADHDRLFATADAIILWVRLFGTWDECPRPVQRSIDYLIATRRS
jgi:hypothetical protein